MNKGAFVERVFKLLPKSTHGMSYERKSQLAHALWEPIGATMQRMANEANELDAALNRLSAENAQLRQWLRGELSISDDDIDEALDNDDHP